MDQAIEAYFNGKYINTRIFSVANGAVVFPEFKVSYRDIGSREALEILVPSIAMIGTTYLGYGNQEKMYVEVEKIYPDFFAD